MKKKEIDNLMGEALDNVRDDRKLAREFLNEIANEQLVKLIGLQQKRQGVSVDLSEDDKDNIFDMIQGTAEDGQ